MRSDLIDEYEIISGIDRVNVQSLLARVGGSRTRGHSFKVMRKDLIRT